MDTCKSFIDGLARINFLKLARDDALKEWGEDIPTTLLFAKIGKSIAEKFDEFLPDERTYIFDAIEIGMRENSISLKTFIATGLLEAVFSRSSTDLVLWRKIDSHLGQTSRGYLTEWRKSH